MLVDDCRRITHQADDQSAVNPKLSQFNPELSQFNPDFYPRAFAPPAEALYCAFIDTDKEFIKSQQSSAGSTANLFLWDPTNYMGHVANCGDTRSVLSRAGKAVDITRDQKASDADEIARISKAGGYVANARVMGILAVARAFGDSNLKTELVPKAVTAEPEITSFRPLPTDEFVIMATDGLWDVMSSQEAVDFAADAIRNSPDIDTEALRLGIKERVNEVSVKNALNSISEALASKAYSLGSQDNITVMVVLAARGHAVRETSDVFTAMSHEVAGARRSQGPEHVSGDTNGRGDRDLRQSEVHKDPVPPGAEGPKTTQRSPAKDDLMDFLMDDSNF